MTLNDRFGCLAIRVADWFSNPLAILLFPIVCAAYLWAGGNKDTLTMILSVLAISTTQLILRAQNVDAEANKLQMAELVHAIPQARDEVAKENLTHDEIIKLKEEIEDVSEKL